MTESITISTAQAEGLKVTAERVVEKLLEYYNEDLSRLENGDYYDDDGVSYFEEIADDLSEDLYGTGIEVDGLHLTLVEQFGGEGEGDEYFVVFTIQETGQFFRFDGYYSSFDGTNWEDTALREVQKTAKTITVYV